MTIHPCAGRSQRVKAWILDPACRRLFADRLTTPEFQRIAATRSSGMRVTFPQMVDAVFDQLTR